MLPGECHLCCQLSSHPVCHSSQSSSRRNVSSPRPLFTEVPKSVYEPSGQIKLILRIAGLIQNANAERGFFILFFMYESSNAAYFLHIFLMAIFNK